ncbi:MULTISPECIES: hypothetical protein [Micromonospora]|uniref:hypothetical protein n=1 Tax=Micromonospora TaxID=1873 RepID=UPI000ACDACD8|nr:MULTISPECIES: hypothetical protein [Micromonospora]MBC8991376.1 hypothetical protein [Micromonospora chalcea]MCK1832799.1 hypothetical protein [Micromonospora sp. R42003]MCK1844191.1 hypothetical protein [Micromonospora sp. R42004]WDP97375.1 hypothetical protein PVK74_15725 [Micromonospora chalcea]
MLGAPDAAGQAWGACRLGGLLRSAVAGLQGRAYAVQPRLGDDRRRPASGQREPGSAMLVPVPRALP